MFKLFLSSVLFVSTLNAIDLNKVKEEVLNYVDGLDHPNREKNNKFSQNLAVTGKAVHTHITIYNDGLAMVSEEKNVTIASPGNVQIMYSDVSSKVDLSSVSMHFDKNVTLYSQRYAYDIVNFNSLLHKYLGKYILYTTGKEDKKQKRATLLATNPVIVKDLKTGNIFTPFKVFFENIPEDMAVTPTLFWNVSTKAKALKIKLEYLSDAIIWKSDYNLYLNTNKKLDFNSWITVENNSGTSYKDVNITIVTGKVKQVIHKDENGTKHNEEKTEVVTKLEKQEAESYALYEVPHHESLRNKEQKQIAFIRAKGVSYSEYLLNDKVYDFTDGNTTVLHFSKMVSFENTSDNHLGFALPEGVVRLYRYDTLFSKRFIGSVKVPDLETGKTVALKVGSREDIVGEEEMTSFVETEGKKKAVYTIKLKNASSESLRIRLQRTIPDQAGEVYVKDSCQKTCTKVKLSELSTRYNIALKAGQIYALEIQYVIKKATAKRLKP